MSAKKSRNTKILKIVGKMSTKKLQASLAFAEAEFKKIKNLAKILKQQEKEVLAIKIESLKITQRALNSLIAEGDILSLGDLVKFTESDLFKRPNLGRATINQIKKELDKYRLSLRADV